MSKISRLQVSLMARGLKNLSGMLQTSDPFAIVTIRGKDPDSDPIIAGHTDVVYNELDPTWSTVVFLDGYKFGVPHFIEVGIFDFSAKTAGMNEKDLAKQSSLTSAIISKDVSRNTKEKTKFPHKIMGSALFEVGEVLGSRGNAAAKRLQNGGELIVHIESSKSNDARKLCLQIGGMDLPNKDSKTRERLGLGKKMSSPFYELYRRVEKPTGDVAWNKVYRSSVVKQNLSPLWEETTLDLETLCNGDLDRTIKIVVLAYRKSGKHKQMGEFKTTVAELLEMKVRDAGSEDFLDLRKSDKTVAGIEVLEDNVCNGKICVVEAGIIELSTPLGIDKKKKFGSIPKNIGFSERPSFVDYLTGGCKVGLTVAIDYTASNGDPIDPDSYHFYDSQKPNDYYRALKSVGKIMAVYDSDQKFPVWGFGVKHGGVLNNCFQCGEEAEVQGVDGILQAYKSVFKPGLCMSNPPDFTEVISSAASYAKFQLGAEQEKGNLAYTILLILTTGNIENVRETQIALEQASQAPLSVVIVGIGNGDFSTMEFLDGDDATVRGIDITQFVSYNDYDRESDLTDALLDEIPDQLVDHFYQKTMMPGEAVRYDAANLRVQEADDHGRTKSFLGSP
mmetsp:Transcript_28981/g.40723  ORF Transcript_28981/g.40723 Transcript_28981/m.40723 type:complete len:618 (-) Transcript_28981:86-1939(-)